MVFHRVVRLHRLDKKRAQKRGDEVYAGSPKASPAPRAKAPEPKLETEGDGGGRHWAT